MSGEGHEGDRRRARVRRISIPLFLVTAAMLAALWWVDWRDWRQDLETQVAMTAEDAALRLEDYVNARLLIAGGLARTSAERALHSDEELRERAETAQELYGGFQAINWVDAEGTIRMVTPLAPNRGALGRSLLDHPVARPAYERARDTGEPQMTDALELFQGGRGFATYYPFERDGVRGYVNGVFRAEALVSTALRGAVLEDYVVSIADDAGTYLLTLPPDVEPGDRTVGQSTLSLLDRTWTLRAWPGDALWERMESARPDIGYLIALLLLALVAWSAHLAMIAHIIQDEAEAHRQRLEHQLERASKMESLGRLAGGVAHDFNNILTAILHSVHLLRGPVEGDPHGELAVDTIIDASARAAELTRQLLTFAKHTPEPPILVDLNEQIVSLQRMLERLLPSEIELSLDLDPKLRPVRIQSAHVGQIVVNLLVNAADAMPEGGTICIRTRQLGQQVQLEVTDTGEGMDAQTRERIFDPFFTTKDEGKGTGLGLATVYGVVTGATGTVDVQSEIGKGTTFDIRLPSERGDRPASDSAIETVPALEPRRLLLVEDDPGLRRALRRALLALGHQVVDVEDGRDALAKLNTETFDGVISDVLMPHVDGYQLHEAIRERWPELPVIICSGHTGDARARVADAHTAVLGKPFEIGDAQRVLEALWDEAGREGPPSDPAV